jgi:hypothetical protein
MKEHQEVNLEMYYFYDKQTAQVATKSAAVQTNKLNDYSRKPAVGFHRERARESESGNISNWNSSSIVHIYIVRNRYLHRNLLAKMGRKWLPLRALSRSITRL